MILPSVRAFLAGLIDYAGLFPPAKLPLDRAIANFVKYRAGSDAWMLGRFVIPAARLAELDAFADLSSSGPPFSLCVLGRGGEGIEAFRVGVAADLQAIRKFRDQRGSSVLVDAYETKPPEQAFQGREAGALQEVTMALESAGLSIVYEVAPTVPASFFSRLGGESAGVKLRCGGRDAAAVPSAEQVAAVIDVCRENGLTLKFTAGLHHPFFHFDRDLQTQMHGFINVFGAAILAYISPISEGHIRAIIEDGDAANFGFDELGFSWKSDRAMTDEIIAARREFVASFGSCSFDEPRADLRAMGILP